MTWVKKNDLDLATEWRRTHPDYVVYVPKGGDRNDTDNEHFLVFKAPKSDELLAMWTQSSVEGHGDNHLVLARSSDGAKWSDPIFVAGTHAGTKELQASWGFPVVSKKGRIYCFYTKEWPKHDVRPHCGGMGCLYSDDNGYTWTVGTDIPNPKNCYDNPDPEVPRNWIVWQLPVRDSKGRWFAGYTQWTSFAVYPPPRRGWVHNDSRTAFLRFENLDENPDPADLRVTWLPSDRLGLEVPNAMIPEMSVCQEPSTVLLPDGRLFVVMRTMTGCIWYSVSQDDGATWRDPEMLRYRDGGGPVCHPMAPCPIYALRDGRFVLVFHNNPGTRGEHSQFKEKWDVNQANYIRNPAHIAVGEFRPGAYQPIWFSQPRAILDTGDIPVGPKGTAETATYTSLTEWHGKRVLWYPDRKYYLLGKELPDSLLADMAVPKP